MTENRRAGTGGARFWSVLVLAAAFCLIGLLFTLAPDPAARVFGIEAGPGAGPYIRALGFRDIALALYLMGLLLGGHSRALSVVLGASVLIPACDVTLVLAVSGWSSWASILLHVAGGVVLAALALWLRAVED